MMPSVEKTLMNEYCMMRFHALPLAVMCFLLRGQSRQKGRIVGR
jgi:hypothetical protein